MLTDPGFGGRRFKSSARNEGNDDIGGMAIEVGTTSVIDCRGARIFMTSSELHVSQRHAGVERCHHEG